MKFTSIVVLLEKSVATLRRFPLVIGSAVFGALCVIWLIEFPNEAFSKRENFIKLAMTCGLALPLFLSLAMYRERLYFAKGKFYLLIVASSVLLFGYYFSIHDVEGIETWTRFVLFFTGAHLLVSVIPYIGCRDYNGFWQYNKSLFIRFITAALYSAVLFLGIALALLAIDNLFEVQINSKNYLQLWVFIAGVFNTWFFLAGVPSDFDALQNSNEYPKGLKIFTQYVLLPLVMLYLGILYAYEIKIFATQLWPVGWVSYLVIGYSVAGIFSLLLIWPIRESEGNAWMKSFARFFYWALFPLIVLLFLAIKKRTDDYGFTENRYFVFVLALWLVLIAAYFLISKLKNIKFVPISLCAIAFLTSFGPWGAFRVSKNSQMKRLMEAVERNNMISDGKIIKANDTVAFDEQSEISSVVDYLVTVHGHASVQPFFSQNLDSLIKSDSIMERQSHQEVKKILSLINIGYVKSNRASEFDEKYIDYRSASDHPSSIAGYHYFISDYSVNSDESSDSICSFYSIENSSLTICFYVKRNLISIQSGEDSLLKFDVSALLNSLKKDKFSNNRLVKVDDMTLVSENARLKASILFKSMYGINKADTITLKRIEADVFIQVKEFPYSMETKRKDKNFSNVD